MQLTNKLISYLHRGFSKDPEQFLAMRLRYDGLMSWQIVDGRLTTTVSGGSGAALDVDLTTLTIATLASYCAAQQGYTVGFVANGAQSGFSARILLDGGNNQDASNGDHIYAYASLIWAYLDAAAIELAGAKTAIVEMLKQMSVSTSSGEFLDDLGDQYGIARLLGESDAIYSHRIIASIILPKGNNVAIEMAIESATGGFKANIVDAPVSTLTNYIYRSGTSRFDGSFSRTPIVRKFYGQFDVAAGFDLLSAESITALSIRIRAAIEKTRDAGTKLRQITLSGGISDTATAATDVSALSFTQSVQDEYIGVRSRHDGSVPRGRLIVTSLRMRNRAGFVYDGSVRRNVADVVSNSATAFYGADIDPATITAHPLLTDNWIADAPYVGMMSRDGTFARTGVRTSGLDNQALSITSGMADVAADVSDDATFSANPALTDAHFIRERSRHDGTVQRRGLVPNPRRMRSRSGFYFDGSVLRSKANFVPDAATDYYGSDIDPVSVATNAALSDSWSADLTYIGLAPRSGVLSRSGLRGIGLDCINLTVTRTAFHNGKFQRTGFPYSGRISEII